MQKAGKKKTYGWLCCIFVYLRVNLGVTLISLRVYKEICLACVHQRHARVHRTAALNKLCFRLENAFTALQIALKIQPNHAIGHANLSAICFAQGKYTYAEEHAIVASRYQFMKIKCILRLYTLDACMIDAIVF